MNASFENLMERQLSAGNSYAMILKATPVTRLSRVTAAYRILSALARADSGAAQ